MKSNQEPPTRRNHKPSRSKLSMPPLFKTSRRFKRDIFGDNAFPITWYLSNCVMALLYCGLLHARYHPPPASLAVGKISLITFQRPDCRCLPPRILLRIRSLKTKLYFRPLDTHGEFPIRGSVPLFLVHRFFLARRCHARPFTECSLPSVRLATFFALSMVGDVAEGSKQN